MRKSANQPGVRAVPARSSSTHAGSRGEPGRATPSAPAAAVARSRTDPKPAQSAKHRVLLVDDHPMTREGLASIINRQPDLAVCREASNAAEAMSVLTKEKPDLMVTDLTMPGLSGIEFLKHVHAVRPQLPMLVLSMHDESLYAERALRAGAHGYLMKDAGPAKVLEVMRVILSGQRYVSPEMSSLLIEAMTGKRPRNSISPIEKLSDREFEVFQLLGRGKSTKEAAEVLQLSPKTVDVHRGRIKEKLHLKDGTSLIHQAVRWVEAQTNRG